MGDVPLRGPAPVDQRAAELQARIEAAVEALNSAPDPGYADPTRREVAALRDANLRAWVILTAGRDPESRRRPVGG